MSFIIDMRRQSHKRKIWFCKKLIFNIYSRVYLKSTSSQSVQLIILNAFKHENENRFVVRFSLNLLPGSSRLR